MGDTEEFNIVRDDASPYPRLLVSVVQEVSSDTVLSTTYEDCFGGQAFANVFRHVK